MKSTVSKLLKRALLEAAAPQVTSKQPAKITVSTATLASRKSTFEHVLDNMDIGTRVGVFLAGPTGVGKTTFVKQLGRLLGMNVIIVEAPHATEEHLVNIPFVVFNTQTGTKKSGADAVPLTTYGVELAQSHLAAELAAQKSIPDAQYLKMIQNSDANTKALYQALGGTDTEIPAEIREARQKYKVILFLDEYQRQVSGNVRNMLRNIINGRIGNDPIPRGTYVIYASNLTDVGGTVEPMNLNQQFDTVHFKAPNKADFFHYITSVFAHYGLTLKPEVASAFYRALDDEHISYDDAETEIRTSPRRWEQLLLYVNEAVPVKTKEEASALLANIKANFQDIDKVSTLHGKVENIVRDIIKLTSGESLATIRANSPTEWRDTLLHQVQMAEKLGDKRKYVPVISGQPGIGKTAMAASVADKLNLRLIAIDCANLTQEEITGIPIPDKTSGHMSVKFSEPALYKRILQDMQAADDAFYADPNVSKADKEEYKNKKYKYLILFDELNRPKSPAVFNSLRRVILEKSFTDTVKLPESAIVIAAMNPTDIGTQPLTGHLKDAMDHIDTAPSWPQTQAYLKSLADAPITENRSDEAKEMALQLTENFADHFALRTAPAGSGLNPESLKFYLKIGDSDAVYISPREYTQMYLNLAKGIDRVVDKKDTFVDADGEFDVPKYVDAVLQAAKSKIMMVLDNVLHKQEVEGSVFAGEVEDWLDTQAESIIKKPVTLASLDSIFDSVVNNPKKHLKDDLAFINWIDNEFSPSTFAEEFENYLTKLTNEEVNAVNFLTAKTHNKKLMQDGVVATTEQMHDKITFLIDEIVMAMQAHKLSSDVGAAVDKALLNWYNQVWDAIENIKDENARNDVIEQFDSWQNSIYEKTRAFRG
jgi:MoxR-like ATPase